MGAPGRVALLSLEPWDGVWRRNQHLAHQLVTQRLVGSLVFVEPPVKLRHKAPQQPELELRTVTPHLVLPRQRGGSALLRAELRGFTRRVDVLWVNDPVSGAACLRPGVRAVYDVTDDWRSADIPDSERAQLVTAEDVLAKRAQTVVCSQVLAERWSERYGIRPPVVQNAADTAAYRDAEPEQLPGLGPHVVYVGTLHRERLDVRLLVELAQSSAVGQVDLVGPDCLDEVSRETLLAAGVVLHGPVDHTRVPAIMAGADVLLCPHRVDAFTMSLDAIKAFEYLATDRSVVATPSSGFQDLSAPGLQVVPARDYVAAVVHALRSPARWPGRPTDGGWPARARRFAELLTGAHVE